MIGHSFTSTNQTYYFLENMAILEHLDLLLSSNLAIPPKIGEVKQFQAWSRTRISKGFYCLVSRDGDIDGEFRKTFTEAARRYGYIHLDTEFRNVPRTSKTAKGTTTQGPCHASVGNGQVIVISPRYFHVQGSFSFIREGCVPSFLRDLIMDPAMVLIGSDIERDLGGVDLEEYQVVDVQDLFVRDSFHNVWPRGCFGVDGITRTGLKHIAYATNGEAYTGFPLGNGGDGAKKEIQKYTKIYGEPSGLKTNRLRNLFHVYNWGETKLSIEQEEYILLEALYIGTECVNVCLVPYEEKSGHSFKGKKPSPGNFLDHEQLDQSG